MTIPKMFVRATRGAAKAGDAAVQGATPLSRKGYKVQLARVAVKRALLAAMKGAA